MPVIRVALTLFERLIIIGVEVFEQANTRRFVLNFSIDLDVSSAFNSCFSIDEKLKMKTSLSVTYSHQMEVRAKSCKNRWFTSKCLRSRLHIELDSQLPGQLSVFNLQLRCIFVALSAALFPTLPCMKAVLRLF